jgi:DNA-binding response OmpR family regulator
LRILVADDTTIERVLLAKLLQSLGHDVVQTEDGAEALEEYKKGSFPMVMLDWMMPKMDGIEACRRIREMDPTNAGYCYIVMVTSKTDKEDSMMALKAGVDDFICKPIDKSEVAARVRVGERILSYNMKLAQKNREMELLQKELTHHNKDLESQIDTLKDQIKEGARPEATLDTPYESLSYGEVHLVECGDDARNRAFELFLEEVTHGIPGLVLSRTYPSKVKEEYNLVNTEVIWITKGLSKGQGGSSYIPLNILAIEEEESEKSVAYNKNLMAVYDIIKEFITTKDECVVLLDGIEYLFTRFDTSPTMEMLYDLGDLVKKSKGKALLSCYPSTIDPTTLSIMKKEMNWVPK